MAYNNQNSINTNSISMFDVSGNLLKISFYDESLNIGIWSPVMDGDRKSYPKEKRESVILTKDRVSALYDIIINKLLPSYKVGENYNGGVFTNNQKTNVFECATMAGEIYCIFHKEIDAERRPKHSFTFHFPKTPIIEKYSPDNGNFDMQDVDASFLLFVKIVEAFMLTAVSGASAHSDRFSNRYMNEKKMSYLVALATKLGVTINTDAPQYTRNGFDMNANQPELSEPTVNNVDGLDGVLN